MHASDRLFIGREREIEALTAGLERTLAGQGQLVMIAGAPGIGKTCTSQAFADIAAELGISPKTVTHHISSILSKVGASNRTEAAAYAARNGLITWQ